MRVNEIPEPGDPARSEFTNALTRSVAPKVWLGLSGNGSLRINIDTDVDCYSEFDPHGNPDEYDKVRDAQNWVEYFVRSTINRLVEKGLLKVPEEAEQ